jgi:hypothetical protein
MLKLSDWVDFGKINWNGLSLNPNAIELLKENKKKSIGLIYLKIQMPLNY